MVYSEKADRLYVIGGQSSDGTLSDVSDTTSPKVSTCYIYCPSIMAPFIIYN